MNTTLQQENRKLSDSLKSEQAKTQKLLTGAPPFFFDLLKHIETQVRKNPSYHVYREDPSKDTLTQAYQAFNKDGISADEIDPVTAAGLVKRILTTLPDKIFDAVPTDFLPCRAKAQSILDQLPPNKKALLEFLAAHLKQLQESFGQNGPKIKELASKLALTLFNPTQENVKSGTALIQSVFEILTNQPEQETKNLQLLSSLMGYLESNAHGTSLCPVYRESPPKDTIDAAYQSLSLNGSYQILESMDPKVAAGLIKRIFRELDEKIFDEIPQQEALQSNHAQQILETLSQDKRDLLKKLVDHFKRVQKEGEITDQTIHGLAVIFAPHLFREEQTFLNMKRGVAFIKEVFQTLLS